MLKLDIIAGARPNFMKIGPIIHAILRHNDKSGQAKIQYRLIHTGQHYDRAMSASFFEQLRIPEPDINLGVGSGTQAYQTGQIMVKYEEALEQWKPDICIVVGDVTSTMACAIVAKKARIRVAHVEGGIRSGDMTMPEEVNRIVTDSITDYFFTTSEYANQHLMQVGVREEQIFFVGNTMIDSLLSNLDRLERPEILDGPELLGHPYAVLTLHRPSNVDEPENLKKLLLMIDQAIAPMKAVFPIHPRTKRIFDQLGISLGNIVLVDPMPYLSFIYLVQHSKAVITDSGGITEEATVLGVPCMTMRDSTERPETVSMGTNEIIGTDPQNLLPFIELVKSGNWKKASIPPLWDGRTSDRIIDALCNLKN